MATKNSDLTPDQRHFIVDFIEQWFASKTSNFQLLTSKDQSRYVLSLGLIQIYQHHRKAKLLFSEITIDELERFADFLYLQKYSWKTIQIKVNHLRFFCRLALEHKIDIPDSFNQRLQSRQIPKNVYLNKNQ